MLSEAENYAIAEPLAREWQERENERKKFDDPADGIDLS